VITYTLLVSGHKAATSVALLHLRKSSIYDQTHADSAHDPHAVVLSFADKSLCSYCLSLN